MTRARHTRCSGEAAGIADRFGDPDLVALSRLGCGQALVAMGNVRDGVPMLDEAMVAVTTGEVSAVAAGIVYCALIIACRDIFDWRRAQEWTVALSRWCAGQQDLKPYRGQCLIHRSELMQLRGDWPDAMAEVQQACQHLAEPPGDPVLGMAHYQRGELLRLRGEFSRAEQAYRKAGEAGHPVQPGLALLRLAQGRIGDAAAAIRRVVAEVEGDRVKRSRVLAAFVEIVLAAGDVAAARTAIDDLDELSSDSRGSLPAGGRRVRTRRRHARRRRRSGRVPGVAPCVDDLAGTRRTVRGRTGAPAHGPGVR